MLKPRHQFMLATALGAGLLVAMPLAFGQSRASEGATVTTDPGFKPGTGEINTGRETPAPSYSSQIISIPTPEQSRAALLAPDDPNPVLGPEPPQQQNSTQADAKAVSPQAAGGDLTKATQGQAAIGGPLAPGASASGAASTDGNSANASAARETTGKNSEGAKPDRPGPIGATGQTMPAKLSNRNDVLDRTPLMAWPSKLSDQERERIYKAVMADQAQAAADADKLMPAGELSTTQALNGLHPLPASVGDIAVVKKLKYVKGKSTVLLVEPSTRIVVEQIKS